MTHLLNNHSPTHVQVCNCATCRNLHNVRLDLSAVPMEGMSNSHVEREAANLVIHAERLLGTAQSILQQHHIFERMSQHSPERQQPFFGPGRITNHVFANKSPLGHSAPESPALSASVNARIDDRSGGASPEKHDGPIEFKDIVRQRAAELGILRNTTNDLSPPPVTPTSTISKTVATRTQPDHDLPQKNTFLVCDHCRSHGIRCNEASVCSECTVREVACTHRQCDLSPLSREDCPRTVCFYVHEDWMPDVHGNHNPGDQNWIILPGKIREHLSAGQLQKTTPKSEEETQRCYAGVPHRQQHAKREIRTLVESGEATWEQFNMHCRCKDIELEEEKTKALEAQLRRMQVDRIDQQSRI